MRACSHEGLWCHLLLLLSTLWVGVLRYLPRPCSPGPAFSLHPGLLFCPGLATPSPQTPPREHGRPFLSWFLQMEVVYHHRPQAQHPWRSLHRGPPLPAPGLPSVTLSGKATTSEGCSTCPHDLPPVAPGRQNLHSHGHYRARAYLH